MRVTGKKGRTDLVRGPPAEKGKKVCAIFHCVMGKRMNSCVDDLNIIIIFVAIHYDIGVCVRPGAKKMLMRDSTSWSNVLADVSACPPR